ncbi:MAG: DinB family protein [Bacteroidia bacterium]
MSKQFLQDIKHILLRDLAVIADEVRQTDEQFLWKSLPGIINPVGTIALHLCGNIRHFIGAQLGHTGYVRNRDAEFSNHQLTKQQLLDEISATIQETDTVLSSLDESLLESEMPDPPPHHKGRSVAFFLMQLSCHLSRHTGQMNYLRRMLESSR